MRSQARSPRAGLPGSLLATLSAGGAHVNLHDKYNQALQTAQGFNIGLQTEEKGGKLYLKGRGPQDQVNKIWDALKTVPDWRNDIVADIQTVAAPPSAVQSATASVTTYTVKAGDTLSKIAKHHLGDANSYMEIFNLNRDQLSDPDKIKPGQVLKLPATSRVH